MQRRQLLQAAGAAVAAFHIVPRHVLGGAGHVPPSERIHLAIVGAGGRGRQVLRGMLAEPDVRVIGVADPARSFSLQDFYYKDVGGREPTRQLIEQHYAQHDSSGKCATYEDFEEMLDAESDLDAVLCGTPDHLHAYVSAKSLRAGKHVYCEKPLTHNLWEAQMIADLARKSGLATQMGNQGHSSDGIRQTCEWLWAGAIGTVREVKAWVSGHRWNPTLTGVPQTDTPVPAGLNWDLWLGPRAERAFEPAYFPVAWRDFWDFGNSNIGDFACHDLDAACWALELNDPTHVHFTPAGVSNADIGPHGCIGYFDFAATDKRPEVKVTWYDGGLQPEKPSGWGSEPLPSRGVLFLGDEGTLFCAGAGGVPRLIGGKNAEQFTPPEPSIPRVASHQRDWLNACRGGSTAGSHFGYGAKLTELALLGALSLRLGKSIEWQAETRQAAGLPEADSIIKESYRDGWEISAV